MNTGSCRDNENGSLSQRVHVQYGRKSTNARDAKTEMTNGREEKLV
jgi:hypothetical protein